MFLHRRDRKIFRCATSYLQCQTFISHCCRLLLFFSFLFFTAALSRPNIFILLKPTHALWIVKQLFTTAALWWVKPGSGAGSDRMRSLTAAYVWAERTFTGAETRKYSLAIKKKRDFYLPGVNRRMDVPGRCDGMEEEKWPHPASLSRGGLLLLICCCSYFFFLPALLQEGVVGQ